MADHRIQKSSHKVKMAVKKAKLRMRARAAERDSLVPEEVMQEPRISIHLNEAANGFIVHMNDEEFIAESVDQVLGIVKEILKDV